MSRQSIVAPIGLITQPSKYGQYKRGALSVATNVVMRSPGVISSMPGVTLYNTASGSVGWATRLVQPGEAGLRVYILEPAGLGLRLNYATSGALTSSAFPSSWDGYAIAGRARFALQRARTFFTSWNTTLVTSHRAPLVYDTEASTTPRVAGAMQPSAFSNSGTSTTNAQAMEADTAAAWRVLVRRVSTSDGYELVSAPSHRLRSSTATALDPNFFVKFGNLSGHVAGDIVELYRTRTVTPADTDPGDVMYLAVSQVLTSTDITNGSVSVRDTCPDNALGLALYTNAGEEGAENANFAPPASSDMTSFKGHMFYAATALPAQAKVGPRIAYGPLLTDADRTYGIGSRTTTGTTTSGSNVITGVVNMRGIVVGQHVSCANFPGNSTVVTGVTATTITCLANASASGAGVSLTTFDKLLYGMPGLLGGEFEVLLGFADSLINFQGYAICSGDLSPAYSLSAGALTLERGVEFVLRASRVYAAGSITLRATNGINYAPPLPEFGATANSFVPDVRENRIAWSKFQQPEHVPPLNFSFVGSGTLYRMVPTRDALWLFCSDGLFRLSGDGGEWRIDAADPNLILAARNAVGTLKETVWAYTNRGLVAISDDGGIQEISLGVIGDQLVGAAFSDTWDTFMSVDQLHQEVWLTLRASPGNSTTYIFNAITKTFVKFTNADYSASEYAPYLQSLVLGRFQSGAVPDLFTFNADTSNTRMAGAEVQYQPLFASDPFDLKQYQSCTYIFEGVNAAATLTPLFDGVASTAFACNQSSGESRATAGVPRRCAIAPVLRPGFQMSNVAAPWSFRGISAKFTPGGEETERD